MDFAAADNGRASVYVTNNGAAGGAAVEPTRVGALSIRSRLRRGFVEMG